MTPPAKRVEVQFVIERACPHATPSPALEAAFKMALPCPVWINWPPEPNTSHCCQTFPFVYRISRKGQRQVEKVFGKRLRYDAPVLCEHMGHVIE